MINHASLILYVIEDAVFLQVSEEGVAFFVEMSKKVLMVALSF